VHRFNLGALLTVRTVGRDIAHCDLVQPNRIFDPNDPFEGPVRSHEQDLAFSRPDVHERKCACIYLYRVHRQRETRLLSASGRRRCPRDIGERHSGLPQWKFRRRIHVVQAIEHLIAARVFLMEDREIAPFPLVVQPGKLMVGGSECREQSSNFVIIVPALCSRYTQKSGTPVLQPNPANTAQKLLIL